MNEENAKSTEKELFCVSNPLKHKWNSSLTPDRSADSEDQIQYFFKEQEEPQLSMIQRLFNYYKNRTESNQYVDSTNKCTVEIDWIPSISPDYNTLAIVTPDSIHFLFKRDQFETEIVYSYSYVNKLIKSNSCWSEDSSLFAYYSLDHDFKLFSNDGTLLYSEDNHFWMNQYHDEDIAMTFVKSEEKDLYHLSILNSKGYLTIYDIHYKPESRSFIDIKVSLLNVNNKEGEIYFLDVSPYLLPPYSMAYQHNYLVITGLVATDTSIQSLYFSSPSDVPHYGFLLYQFIDKKLNYKFIDAMNFENKMLQMKEPSFLSTLSSYLKPYLATLDRRPISIQFSPSHTFLSFLTHEGLLYLYSFADTAIHSPIDLRTLLNQEDDAESTSTQNLASYYQSKLNAISTAQWWRKSILSLCTYNGCFYLYDTETSSIVASASGHNYHKGCILYGDHMNDQYLLDCHRILHQTSEEEATIEKSYWIHSIQSATIEEYYQYLLNRQEYATAYTHATKYHLPLDDYYKSRWEYLITEQNSTLTTEDIDHDLVPIEDLYYVLNQCYQYNPLKEEILDYLITVGLEKCSSSMKDSSSYDLSTLQGHPEKELIVLYKYMFSMKQTKLQLYKSIIQANHQSFDRKEFEDLSALSLLELFKLYTKKGEIENLKICFDTFSSILLPYREEILEVLPTYIQPEKYDFLLPVLSLSKENQGEFYYGTQDHLSSIQLDQDHILSTFEDIQILLHLHHQIDQEIYHSLFPEQYQSILDDFKHQIEPFEYIHENYLTLSAKQIETEFFIQWYKTRVILIDQKCGYLTNCLALLKLAESRCSHDDYAELQTLYQDLSLLYRIVYINHGKSTLFVSEWIQKSLFEKIEYILGPYDPQTFESIYINKMKGIIGVSITPQQILNYICHTHKNEDGIAYLSILLSLYSHSMEDPKQMNPLPNLEMLILYQYLYEYLFNFEQIDDYESANKLLYNFLTDSTLSQQEDTDEYKQLAKLYQYYKASILLYQAHHIFFTVKALSTIHDTESEMLQNHEYSLYSDVEEKRLDFLRIIELQSVSLLCYIAKVEDNEEQKEKKWDLVLQDINTVRQCCFEYLPDSIAYYIVLDYILNYHYTTALDQYKSIVDDQYLTIAICKNNKDYINSLNSITNAEIDTLLVQLTLAPLQNYPDCVEEHEFLCVLKELYGDFNEILPFQLRQSLLANSTLYYLSSFSKKLYLLHKETKDGYYILNQLERLGLTQTQLLINGICLAESASLNKDYSIAEQICLYLKSTYPIELIREIYDHYTDYFSYNYSEKDPHRRVFLIQNENIINRYIELLIKLLKEETAHPTVMSRETRKDLCYYALQFCSISYITQILEINDIILMEERANHFDALEQVIGIHRSSSQEEDSDQSTDSFDDYHYNNMNIKLRKNLSPLIEEMEPEEESPEVSLFDNAPLPSANQKEAALMEYIENYCYVLFKVQDYSKFQQCSLFYHTHISSYLAMLFSLYQSKESYSMLMDQYLQTSHSSQHYLLLYTHYLQYLYYSYYNEPITTLSHYSPYYMYSYLYDKGDQDQKEKLRSIFIQINKLYVYQYLYTKDPSFSCSMFLSSDKVACSCLNRILDVADAATRDQISTIAPLFNMNQYLIYYHKIEVLLCSEKPYDQVVQQIESELLPPILINEQYKQDLYESCKTTIYHMLDGTQYNNLLGLFKILISLCEASEKEVYDYCIQVLTLLNEMTIHYDFKKLLQCEDHILSELPTLSLDLNHTLFYPMHVEDAQQYEKLFALFKFDSSSVLYLYIKSVFYSPSGHDSYEKMFEQCQQKFESLPTSLYYDLVLHFLFTEPLDQVYSNDNQIFRRTIVDHLYKRLQQGEDYKTVSLLHSFQVFADHIQPLIENQPSLYTPEQSSIEQLALSSTDTLQTLLYSFVNKPIPTEILLSFLRDIHEIHPIALSDLYLQYFKNCLQYITDHWTTILPSLSDQTNSCSDYLQYLNTYDESLTSVQQALIYAYNTMMRILNDNSEQQEIVELQQSLYAYITHEFFTESIAQLYTHKSSGTNVNCSPDGCYLVLWKLILYSDVLKQEDKPLFYGYFCALVLALSGLLTDSLYSILSSTQFRMDTNTETQFMTLLYSYSDSLYAPIIRLLLEFRYDLNTIETYSFSMDNILRYCFILCTPTVYKEEDQIYSLITSNIIHSMKENYKHAIPQDRELDPLYYNYLVYLCQHRYWNLFFTLRYMPLWSISSPQETELLSLLQEDIVVYYVVAKTSMNITVRNSISIDQLSTVDFTSLAPMRAHMLLLYLLPEFFTIPTLCTSLSSFIFQYTNGHILQVLYRHIGTEKDSDDPSVLVHDMNRTSIRNETESSGLLCFYKNIYEMPPFIYSILFVLCYLICKGRYETAVLLYYRYIQGRGDQMSGLKFIYNFLQRSQENLLEDNGLPNGWSEAKQLIQDALNKLQQYLDL